MVGGGGAIVRVIVVVVVVGVLVVVVVILVVLVVEIVSYGTISPIEQNPSPPPSRPAHCGSNLHLLDQGSLMLRPYVKARRLLAQNSVASAVSLPQYIYITILLLCCVKTCLFAMQEFHITNQHKDLKSKRQTKWRRSQGRFLKDCCAKGGPKGWPMSPKRAPRGAPMVP